MKRVKRYTRLYICYVICMLLGLIYAGCNNGVNIETHNVDGCIESCNSGMNGVTLTLSNKEYGTVTVKTDEDGNYDFSNVWKGDYTITPSKSGYTFFPENRTISTASGNLGDLDFITMLSWTNRYREGVQNRIYHIEQTTDCGFIMCGMIDRTGAANETGTENLDFWVVKLDMYGDVEWEWIDGGDYIDIAYSIHANNDGTYVVTGTSGDEEGVSDVRIVQISVTNEGEPVSDWNVYYEGDVQDEGRNVLYSQNHDQYIVSGFTESNSSGFNDFFILTVNTDGMDDGDTIFTYDEIFIKGEEDYYEEAHDMIVTHDSNDGTPDGFIMAGYNRHKDSVIKKAVIKKMDNNFKEILDLEYVANEAKGEPAEITIANSIIETSDNGYLNNGYIVVGNTQLKENYQSDMWICKLHNNGTIDWELVLDKGLNDGANSVYQTSDNGFIVGGYMTSEISGTSDYWIVKLSNSGEKLWEKVYSGDPDSDDEITSIMQTSDGGYLFAGYVVKKGNDSKDYSWLIKLDAYGNIVSEK